MSILFGKQRKAKAPTGSSHFPCGTGILLGPSSQVILRNSEGEVAAKDALNAFGEVGHREIHRRDGKSNSSVTFAETQPQRQPALLRLGAIIPRTVSPAALCLFCFLERNQEVSDRAASDGVTQFFGLLGMDRCGGSVPYFFARRFSLRRGEQLCRTSIPFNWRCDSRLL
jgi:hypothetical protein